MPVGWTSECAPLDTYAGQTLNAVAAYKDRATPAGTSWDLLFADVVFVRRDGTVIQQVTAGRGGGALAQSPDTSFDPVFRATVEDVRSLNDTVVPAGSSRAARLTHFSAGDHLGTAQMEFSSGGYPVWQGQFGPYGDELDQQTTNNHYKFTGKERDTESGLDYFGARYYASSMGRWMSPDPKAPSRNTLFNPQKWNKYNYVLNNPLSNIDPDGLEEITIQLRAYIPQAHVGTYGGDNRGPTASQDVTVTSRTWITLRIETDPKISANPLLSNSGGHAGVTHNDFTGNTAIQTRGLPNAQVSRDANFNVVITIKQDAANTLAPSPRIRSDITIGVPVSGSSVTTSGTVSGSPAFETNVGKPGNAIMNVPLQRAPINVDFFSVGLYETNQLSRTTTPRPPPGCTSGQAGCSQ